MSGWVIKRVQIIPYRSSWFVMKQNKKKCLSVCLFSSSSSNSNSKKEDSNISSDTYISSFPRAPNTSDSVRVKCREMLAAALKTGGKNYITVLYLFFIQFHIFFLFLFNTKCKAIKNQAMCAYYFLLLWIYHIPY